jgi:hypothetical protein
MRLRQLVAVAAVVAAIGAVAAAPATGVPVSLHVVESLKAPPFTFPTCPDIGLDVNCGTGEFRPFGRVDSIVSIGACGDTCNIRWITAPQGTIVLREIASDFSCPGACATAWPHGGSFYAILTATVVGGDGIFEGATGSLTGTLKAVALQAQITYSGEIALAG